MRMRNVQGMKTFCNLKRNGALAFFYRAGFDNFYQRGAKILAFNIFSGEVDCQLGGVGGMTSESQDPGILDPLILKSGNGF